MEEVPLERERERERERARAELGISQEVA